MRKDVRGATICFLKIRFRFVILAYNLLTINKILPSPKNEPRWQQWPLQRPVTCRGEREAKSSFGSLECFAVCFDLVGWISVSSVGAAFRSTSRRRLHRSAGELVEQGQRISEDALQKLPNERPA